MQKESGWFAPDVYDKIRTLMKQPVVATSDRDIEPFGDEIFGDAGSTDNDDDDDDDE